MDRNKRLNKIFYMAAVALRKESVDRNESLGISAQHLLGRSPQGERG